LFDSLRRCASVVCFLSSAVFFLYCVVLLSAAPSSLFLSGWNADAGRVRAASRSPANSRIRFVLEFGVLPIRAARSRSRCACFFFWTRFVHGVSPDPNPMRVPTKTSASLGAILVHAESGVPMWIMMRRIEIHALYGLWGCICATIRGSLPVSATGIGIGTCFCACFAR
jgi:hypothetical protein